MIRLLLLAILVFVAYTIISMVLRLLGSGGRPPSVPRERTQAGEEMVKDPQCGTYLPKGDALSAQVRGQTQYFCSRECRDSYLETS